MTSNVAARAVGAIANSKRASRAGAERERMGSSVPGRAERESLRPFTQPAEGARSIQDLLGAYEAPRARRLTAPSVRRADLPAAEAAVPVVEHRELSRRDRDLWLVEPHLHASVRTRLERGGCARMVVADACGDARP